MSFLKVKERGRQGPQKSKEVAAVERPCKLIGLLACSQTSITREGVDFLTEVVGKY